MKTVRHLHSLSAQLLLLKSTVSPFHALIQSLRYSDTMKTLAVTKAAEGVPATTNDLGKVGAGKKTQQVGFVSSETKVYLGDVLDHVEGVLSSLDLFSGMSVSHSSPPRVLLTGLLPQSGEPHRLHVQRSQLLLEHLHQRVRVFSRPTNPTDSGSRLSILSVIFLPLTFLSGYFGMNFGSVSLPRRGYLRRLTLLLRQFDHVLDGDVSYFWSIAIPVTATTLSLFAWEYFVAVYQLARRTLVDLYCDLVSLSYDSVGTYL